VAGDTFPHHDDFLDAGGVWELHEKHWVFRDTESVQKLRSLVPQPPYFLPSRSLGILSTEVPSSVKFLKYAFHAILEHWLILFLGQAKLLRQRKMLLRWSWKRPISRTMLGCGIFALRSAASLTSCTATTSRGAKPQRVSHQISARRQAVAS
jgi:hypothetical protein